MFRKLICAVLVTVVPFGLVACGDDEKSETDATTTTEQASDDSTSGGDETESTDGTDESDDTTTTAESTDPADDSGDDPADDSGGDEEIPFAEGIADFEDRLAGADGDTCALVELTTAQDQLAEPTGAEETERAANFTVALLTAIADAAPPEFAAQAEVIRETAEKFAQEAEDADYDKAILDESELFEDEAFGTAIGAFFQSAQEQCG